MFIVEKNILFTILASLKMENRTQNTNKKSQETKKIWVPCARIGTLVGTAFAWLDALPTKLKKMDCYLD